MSQTLSDQSNQLLSNLPDNIKDLINSTIGSDTSGVDVNQFISLAFGMGPIVQNALFTGNFGNVLSAIGQFIINMFTVDPSVVTNFLLGLLNPDGAIPDQMVSRVKGVIDNFGILGPIMSIIFIAVTSLTSLKSLLGLANQFSERNFKDTFRLTELEPRSLIRSVFINPSTYDDVVKRLQSAGYPDDDITLMMRAERQAVAVDTIKTLYLKGEITFDYMKMRMHENGYSDARITETVEGWLHVQSFGEYMQGISRGAHRDDLDTLLGLSADYPQDFIQQAAKTGVGGEDALFAWRSHWTLPDPRTTLLMRERGLISDAAYKLILEFSGIPPAQIDNMTEVNYQLLPVRMLTTMYHEGVMSDDDLMREIVSYGYGDKRAALMFQYIKESSAATKTLQTAGHVIQAYAMHAFTRDDAKAKLIELHYSESDAEFALMEQDTKENIAIAKETELTVMETYQARLIDEVEARQALVSIQYAPTYIDALINRWNVRRNLITALPSKSDLDKFLAANTIDENTWISYMQRLRYPTDVILMYLDYNSEKKTTSVKVSQLKQTQTLAIKVQENCYKAGTCSDADVDAALGAVGINQTIIDTYKAEWAGARTTAATKAATAAAKTPGA